VVGASGINCYNHGGNMRVCSMRYYDGSVTNKAALAQEVYTNEITLGQVAHQ